MTAGNAKAVETFYSQYFDFLYHHARRATRRDEAFCLDVVQDAVIRIMRTIRRVESGGQASPGLAWWFAPPHTIC